MNDRQSRAGSAALVSAAALLGLLTWAPGDAAAQMGKDWITVVLSEEPFMLDGCNMNNATAGPVVRQNIVETLTEVDPRDGTLTPRLAESWEKINETTWRFKLRKGVTYHDGEPFNAKSAAFGIARTMENKHLDCETRQKTFGQLLIKGVPVDEYTLDVVADKPEPILATRMGIVGLVSPKTTTEKLVLTPVGTGPYEFVSYEPGTTVMVKRNDKYWGGKPVVAGAKYLWRKESSVRAAMVKVGEADISPNIASQDATEPKLDYSYNNPETTYVRIQMDAPPLNDLRVRQALNYALDWEGIRGTILPKDVKRATQIIGVAASGHNHDIDKKLYPYDPAKAKALLAAAKADGVKVDTPMWILGRHAQFPNVAEVLEAMQGMYKAVGFNFELRMLETGALDQYQNKTADGSKKATDHPPLLLQEMHDNTGGDAVFSMFNKSNCKGRQSFICDQTVDDLTAKASITSGPERVKLWQEVQRRLYEDLVAFVYLGHMVGFSRVNERLNFTPTVSTNTELQIAQIKFK